MKKEARLYKKIPGSEAGLLYVYLGNVAASNDTACHHCGRTVIKRNSLFVEAIELTEGRCPTCNTEIAGRWRTVLTD
jgi:pyruvate formate lyase activating enzyme